MRKSKLETTGSCTAHNVKFIGNTIRFTQISGDTGTYDKRPFYIKLTSGNISSGSSEIFVTNNVIGEGMNQSYIETEPTTDNFVFNNNVTETT